MVKDQYSWFSGRCFDIEQRDVTLYCVVVVFAFLKLYLVGCQRMTALGLEGYDDGLFLDLARNIASGAWLGAYNARSLIKGPVYPAWIALNYKLGIPLILGAHLLYISACFLVILFFKKRLSNFRLLLLYVIILFNPMSFSNGIMTQALRSNIYPALAMMVAGSSGCLVFNHNGSAMKNVCLAFFLGVSFSLFWFTREESLWIVPLLSIVFLYLFKNKSCGVLGCKRYIGGVSLALVAAFVFLFSVYGLERINKHYYGVPVTLEVKSDFFEKAYGSLLRVENNSSELTAAIPVPREVRKKIYKVSPSFRELESYFEGVKGDLWAGMIHDLRHQLETDSVPMYVRRRLEGWLEADKSGLWSRIWDDALEKKDEIYGLFFIWAFRGAVFDAGYSTLPKAMEYYSRLSSEINSACEEGRLKCLPLRASLIPAWNNSCFPALAKTFLGGIFYLTTFREFNPIPDFSSASRESMELIRQETYEDLMPVYVRGMVSQPKDYRFKIMWVIGFIYQKVIPILALLSLVVYFFKTMKLRLSILNDDIWIINTGLLFSMLLLLFALSYIQITSFPALISRYLAPLYPLMLLFIFLSLNEYADIFGQTSKAGASLS